MQPIIIADASCLILLEKIGELSLLQKLFIQITVTQIVADEFGMHLPDWIAVENPSALQSVRTLQILLDRGEASSIALAIEKQNSLLIIDELKGRKIAVQLGLNITGTMALVADAKLNGIIPSVKPIVEKIKQTNFRLSKKLEQLILKKASEE